MGRRLTLAMAGLTLVIHLAGVACVPAATEDGGATQTLKDTTEQVLKVLREEGSALKKRPERLYAIIDELILPHFDFRRMSGWVLGRHWRKATEAQKDQFAQAFQGLLVRTYAQALLDYRDQTVNFLGSRKREEGDVTVRAQIDQGSGPAIPIAYEVSRVNGRWLVYDIAVNGVSLVINYRSSFNQVIRRNGLDGLIKRLEDHNTKQVAS